MTQASPTPLEYDDFELEIGQPRQDGTYRVAVIRAVGGEAEHRMRLPIDHDMLPKRLGQLRLLRTDDASRDIKLVGEQAEIRPSARARELGRQLFEALMGGQIGNRYEISLMEARQHHKNLRIKLRIRTPELALVPWELLYDPQRGVHIAQSSETPIVRYLNLDQTIRPLTTDRPLRILGMIASPRSLARLGVEQERQWVTEALRDLEQEGEVQITWVRGQTLNDLEQALRRDQYHIFHFIGHGKFDPTDKEGRIALCGQQGQVQDISASNLGQLLRAGRTMRLAILNACEGARGSSTDLFSSSAATLVRQGIPAVLAMQYAITDKAAIEFARRFYGELAQRRPVDAATSDGRWALSVQFSNTVEWATPVLYMRSPDGQLFGTARQTSTQSDTTGQRNVPARRAADPTKPARPGTEDPELLRLYYTGRAALNNREWVRAEELFINLIERQPNYPGATEALAEARQGWWKAKKIEREQRNKNYMQAQSLHKQGRNDDAKKILEDILDWNPKHAGAKTLFNQIEAQNYRNAGMQAYYKGNWAEATKNLEEFQYLLLRYSSDKLPQDIADMLAHARMEQRPKRRLRSPWQELLVWLAGMLIGILLYNPLQSIDPTNIMIKHAESNAELIRTFLGSTTCVIVLLLLLLIPYRTFYNRRRMRAMALTEPFSEPRISVGDVVIFAVGLFMGLIALLSIAMTW